MSTTRLVPSFCAALALGLSFVSVACSSKTTGTGPSGGTSGAAGATGNEQSCFDTIEAIARAGERCGESYQSGYDVLLKDLGGGDCKKVMIRDEASLRSTCLPSLKSAPCADLTAGKVDASCAKQLQRPASVQPVLGPASFFASDDEAIEP
jgi:hypothetical protein